MGKIVDCYVTSSGHQLEYSIQGAGIPILVLHGGHSNCHEDMGYTELIEQGYSIITPSRPGYGRTAKALGSSLDDASSAYVELLVYLNLQRVHVIAISAGGLSGIYLASNYPNCVETLTLQSAVTKQWLTPHDRLYKAGRIMFNPFTEQIVWTLLRLMNKISPKFACKSMIASFSSQNPQLVTQQFSDQDWLKFSRMLTRQRSGSGFMIDLTQTCQNIAHESKLSSIQSPTLILHSQYDASVPAEHAYHAQQMVPKSELHILKTWGHLIWIGDTSKEMYPILFEFLEANQIRNKGV
ncbi:alpha/beta hydrolase [Paenibacillus sp. N1-5-1-14]|uniref:alpha/beta fold hydrolase n=1 Tax=Paenibacillus radicibacter TaxID=2972488 RepID=UPI002158B1B9|nr:alpha/beta hydrolase [Paenibacillus radicibacter]MCR8643753.1 alpha/beta hydrolase [Paenibacillus radicibacter]